MAALSTDAFQEKRHGTLLRSVRGRRRTAANAEFDAEKVWRAHRSEEHTSELQSHSDLVCRLLLEKKNKINLLEFNTVNAPTHESASYLIDPKLERVRPHRTPLVPRQFRSILPAHLYPRDRCTNA